MLFVIAAVVILVVWIIHDVVAQVEPDLQVAYVGSTELPSDTVDALENALLPYCTDRNGDGEVIVQLNQFTVTFGEESQDADPYSQMAGITKLSAELAADSDTYLFLLADPEGFQEQTQALQYTDGTLPPEEAVENAVVLEEVARMAILTRQIDPQAVPAPHYLQSKHFRRKHGPNAYYGQK